MKTWINILFCLWLMPYASAQKPHKDSIDVTIILKNKKPISDSVLVIFDRYDLTGAGVIRKIYYLINNKIVIEKVPKGKYYVDVFCNGTYHQNYTRISTIGDRRPNKLSFHLKPSELYIPGEATIPPYPIDLNNLVVTPEKNFQVIALKKKEPPEGGCTNQIPLTIKPYPMKNQI